MMSMQPQNMPKVENFTYLNDSERELSNWLLVRVEEHPVPLWMQQKVTSLLNVTRIRWARRGYV